jgi:hypothetical protein
MADNNDRINGMLTATATRCMVKVVYKTNPIVKAEAYQILTDPGVPTSNGMSQNINVVEFSFIGPFL